MKLIQNRLLLDFGIAFPSSHCVRVNVLGLVISHSFIVLNLRDVCDDPGSKSVATDVKSRPEAVQEPVNSDDDGVHSGDRYTDT